MAQAASAVDPQHPAQAPRGSVRTCTPYRGELARHRLITADGHDYVVTTIHVLTQGFGTMRTNGFVTGAYPVLRGYLVMMRQPLYEITTADGEAARDQHEQLVRVLAEAGVGVVRARRSLAARLRAEKAEAARTRAMPSIVIEMAAAPQVSQGPRDERNPLVLS